MRTSKRVRDLSAGSGSGAHRRGGRGARKSGAEERAAQIVLGIAVTARKPGAAELQDGSHFNGGGTSRKQFPHQPKIDNAPVRLWKALGNMPSPDVVLIDLDGLGRRDRSYCILGSWARRFPGGGKAWRRGPRGRLQQVLGLRSQAGASVQELDPRWAAACAAFGLLVREPGQSSEVTPVGAGRIAAVGVRDALGDGCGQSRLQGLSADVQPSLQMASAGVQHNARFESITTHRFQHGRGRCVEVEQNVAGVPNLGVGMQVDITSFAITQAEKANGSRARQLSGAPQPLSREGAAGGVMNQTDKVEIMRHGRELAANGVRGKEKSAIQHVPMLRSNGKLYNRFSANGNCVFSAVSHRRGSPQYRRSSAFIGGVLK